MIAQLLRYHFRRVARPGWASDAVRWARPSSSRRSMTCAGSSRPTSTAHCWSPGPSFRSSSATAAATSATCTPCCPGWPSAAPAAHPRPPCGRRPTPCAWNCSRAASPSPDCTWDTWTPIWRPASSAQVRPPGRRRTRPRRRRDSRLRGARRRHLATGQGRPRRGPGRAVPPAVAVGRGRSEGGGRAPWSSPRAHGPRHAPHPNGGGHGVPGTVTPPCSTSRPVRRAVPGR